MAQIKSDRDIARDSNRAFVTGGPGHRKVEGDRQIGIISTAMNAGKTPAFPKGVYWGACKKSEWKTVGQKLAPC
jgi:hypothetical protein